GRPETAPGPDRGRHRAETGSGAAPRPACRGRSCRRFYGSAPVCRPGQTRLASPFMHTLTRRQLVILVLLTLVWGVNWPVMKLGVTDFPPLTFRAISMWIGLPVLAGILIVRKVSFRIGRRHWRELLWLTLVNML